MPISSTNHSHIDRTPPRTPHLAVLDVSALEHMPPDLPVFIPRTFAGTMVVHHEKEVEMVTSKTHSR